MKVSVFYVLLLAFVFAGSKTFAKESFEIIKPLSLSIYEEDSASIVIKRLDDSMDRITILFENNSTKIIETKEKRKIYCSTVKLKLGNNKITLIGYDKSENMTVKEINLYHTSEVYEGFHSAPSKYKRNYFHTNKNEKLCTSCHNMKEDRKNSLTKHINKSDITSREFDVLDNPEKSNCYQCHNKITHKKNGHAPSVNFLCTECHTGKSGEFNAPDQGKSKYLMPDPIMSTCFSCHEGIKTKWFSNTSEHGPLRSGRCNKCHNPHSSEYEFFLRKSIWDLCTTCHDEKASGKHIIGSFVFSRNKGGHPTKGREDPSRPGRELVCSSCHNPHGSNGIYLLRSDGKDTFSVCKRCHDK